MQPDQGQTGERSLSDRYPQEAKCLGCGYPLRGLPQHTCPECGRPFDPRDPTSFKVPGLGRPPSLSWPDWAAIGTTALLVVAPTSCTCGYMGWFSLWFTVPAVAAVWWGMLRSRVRHVLARTLYVIVAAIVSTMLLKNIADILWFGHEPLLNWGSP
jgi:hypothetical protein